MSAHLDLDDVCAGHPQAQDELTRLRAENEVMRATVKSLVDGTSGYGDGGRWSINMQTVLKARAALAKEPTNV